MRAAAAARAAARDRLPFAGRVEDAEVAGVRVRRYLPTGSERSGCVFFAHGGYGLFGTLDLQDGYCRILAEGLSRPVIAVDYGLAPEHHFSSSVDDFLSAVRGAKPSSPVILAGDSAGGAIAVEACARLPEAAALLLTNPNLDLTLASFDSAAPGGPDLKLSQYAFAAWTRGTTQRQAPRLHEPHHELPPTFIAIGARDALVPEARALVRHLHGQGTRASLLELPQVGHGFSADLDVAATVVSAMAHFLGAEHV